jgi:hypothetical protein
MMTSTSVVAVSQQSNSKATLQSLSTITNDVNRRDAIAAPASTVKKARISQDRHVPADEIVQRVRLLFAENDVASLVS